MITNTQIITNLPWKNPQTRGTTAKSEPDVKKYYLHFVRYEKKVVVNPTITRLRLHRSLLILLSHDYVYIDLC
jgi:uncharacterized protein (DUF952 family)